MDRNDDCYEYPDHSSSSSDSSSPPRASRWQQLYSSTNSNSSNAFENDIKNKHGHGYYQYDVYDDTAMNTSSDAADYNSTTRSENNHAEDCATGQSHQSSFNFRFDQLQNDLEKALDIKNEQRELHEWLDNIQSTETAISSLKLQGIDLGGGSIVVEEDDSYRIYDDDYDDEHAQRISISTSPSESSNHGSLIQMQALEMESSDGSLDSIAVVQQYQRLKKISVDDSLEDADCILEELEGMMEEHEDEDTQHHNGTTTQSCTPLIDRLIGQNYIAQDVKVKDDNEDEDEDEDESQIMKAMIHHDTNTLKVYFHMWLKLHLRQQLKLGHLLKWFQAKRRHSCQELCFRAWRADFIWIHGKIDMLQRNRGLRRMERVFCAWYNGIQVELVDSRVSSTCSLVVMICHVFLNNLLTCK